jgi:predicted peroxiredoxin
MSVYLLIETRSEWESREVAGFLDLAGRLAAEGNDVDLFLVQNGVLNAKAGTSPALGALLGGAGAGVTVWVDDFSLSNRALAPSDLLPGPEVAGIGTLVDLLTRSGCKPIWH